ncbi:MAG TPA: hypothetical protein VFE46_08760 [Pirellulales bacterium]|jgi:hypothetical protein|nr:hypothetical protein [Pirellulales bacterium]
MLTLNFDSYTSLVEFRQAVLSAIKEGQVSVIVSESEVLFAAISPEMTKEMIAKRVATRLAENPNILAEIKERLETQEPEDWE